MITIISEIQMSDFKRPEKIVTFLKSTRNKSALKIDCLSQSLEASYGPASSGGSFLKSPSLSHACATMRKAVLFCEEDNHFYASTFCRLVFRNPASRNGNGNITKNLHAIAQNIFPERLCVGLASPSMRFTNSTGV